jgi:hypothetical protein
MQVIKKISNVKYEVISKNFFDKRSEFKVIGKKLNKIEYFKIVSIIDINNKCEVEVVNKPMTKLMIKINRQINMSPGDILRIC